MAKVILALDQGTTATSCLVLGPEFEVLAKGSMELTQHYPKPGWVEHDPDEIWAITGRVIRETLKKAGVSGADVAAIGITNQRETTIVWDRKTMKPVHNAIVWQCRRTADFCQDLKNRGKEDLFREKTGLVLDPYFSGTKVRWILDNVPGARDAGRTGELAFGTVDSFLLAHLTGGAVHATEPSNASRTLLYDIHAGAFDPELAAILGVPMEMLPDVLPSAGVFGHTRGLDFLPDGIPIAGIAGDQQAALFGQGCLHEGEAKCTYGTGAFVLLNTGDKAVPSHRGLLTTVAWQIDGKLTYALEGSAFIAGAAVQWLRDGLGLIKTAPEIESLARSVKDNGGVVFVPALSGLGAPYWRPDVRGTLAGITRGTTAGHIARAVLEGIALEVYDLVIAMAGDLGGPLRHMQVDGGASMNDLMMQFQADLLGLDVVRPRVIETTAFGAGLMAAYGAGLVDDLGLLPGGTADKVFSPVLSRQEARKFVDDYHNVVNMLLTK